jgi:hypothetical protein
VVVYICHPSYEGSINRILVKADPGIDATAYSRNTYSTKG